MPVSFLTKTQQRQYGRYAGDPDPEQLAHYFQFDDHDRYHLATLRGRHELQWMGGFVPY